MELYKSIIINKITRKFFLLGFLLVFASCNSTKSAVFTQSPPFEIQQTSIVKEPNESIIYIDFHKLPESVRIHEVHYQKMIAKTTQVESSENTFKAVFFNNTNWNLSDNPEEEAANKIQLKSEFDMDENHFIIGYFYNGEKYLYKAKLVQKPMD